MLAVLGLGVVVVECFEVFLELEGGIELGESVFCTGSIV